MRIFVIWLDSYVVIYTHHQELMQSEGKYWPLLTVIQNEGDCIILLWWITYKFMAVLILSRFILFLWNGTVVTFKVLLWKFLAISRIHCPMALVDVVHPSSHQWWLGAGILTIILYGGLSCVRLRCFIIQGWDCTRIIALIVVLPSKYCCGNVPTCS